jgi:CelD/BcsL family acetyltransferase involved in cellulose biosynthesis
MYVYEEGGVNKLFLLGMGTSDYMDGLFEAGFEDLVCKEASAHMAAERSTWNIAELHQLRPFSPLPRLRDSPPLKEGLGVVVEQVPMTGQGAPLQTRESAGEPCPVLSLCGNVEDTIPKRMLQNLRYYERRAEKAGPISYKQGVFLDDLIRLHTARWRSQGESGVLADEAVQGMHRECVPCLQRLGLLRMYALSISDRIAAVYYGFLHRGRAYYYLSGIDPAFQHLSIGTLIVGCAIKEAIREGATAFDFLRGQEPYKYLWGAKDEPTNVLRFTAEGLA